MKFHFKEFDVEHDRSTMKVGTDAVLLGCLANAGDAEKILEIGCGCGVISLMLAQRFPNAEIHAIDIDENSIEETKQNFANSKWHNRLSAECVSLQSHSLIHPKSLSKLYDFATLRLYDCIISNPPFFSNSLHSPSAKKNLAKHVNNLDYRQLLNCSAKLLKDAGRIIVIIPANEMQIFNTALVENNLYINHLCNIFFKSKQNPDRVIISISKLNSNNNTPPCADDFTTLRLYDSTISQYSPEYLALVKNFLTLNS